MRKVIAAFVALSIGSLVVVTAQGGDAAKGQATYVEKKCGTCHKTTKADDKGGKLSTVLGDTVGKMSAADIKAWITNPKAQEAKLPKKPVMPMSTYLGTLKPALTEAEINNLVAYVQTLPGK